MIYLYNYTTQPWKAQKHVREVLDRLYSYHPDGYCGDEDNGQTSAWYVFSSLGFYPVCPGTDEYVFGAPLFDKVTMQLENGNQFVIKAPGNSKTNLYVNDIQLNGKVYNKNYIKHNALQAGGELIFNMSKTPNKTRGTKAESYPYSMSDEE
jgi:predicted alpha-1,2-mannosidase